MKWRNLVPALKTMIAGAGGDKRMDKNYIKKYINFSREYLKKAAKYRKSQSSAIHNAGKSTS